MAYRSGNTKVHNVGGIAGLAVKFVGAEQTKAALAGLPAAIQRKVLRGAVRAAAQPVAKAVRANLKAIADASRQREGTGASARAVIIKVAALKRDPSVVYGLVGARKGYVEHVSLQNSAGDRAPIESIDSQLTTRKGRRGQVVVGTPKRLKNIGKAARRAKLSRKSNSTKKRAPARYLHLLEKGANNKRTGKVWAGKTPLVRAASATQAAAKAEFTRLLDAGIQREFGEARGEMSLSTSLYSYCTGQASISALIGTRMYPQIAPSGAALPYTVYRRRGRKREGQSSGATGSVATMVSMLHYAETHASAEAVAEVFRKKLDGKQRATVGTEYFSRCSLDDEADTLDVLEFAQNDAPHFVRQEYSITHTETLG